MPTVPRYDQQVNAQAAPNVQFQPAATPEAFGGGPSLNQAVQAGDQLASTADKIAREEKEKADQLAVLDADSKAAALETKIQYDPQTGAMNARGRDVFGLPDQVKTAWDKGMDDITKGLNNDDQRLAFKKNAVTRWASIDSNVQRHMSTEIQQYDADTTDSYIKNEQTAAAMNYLDGSRIAMAVANQQKAITDFAQRTGKPSDWSQEKIQQVASDTHASVIERMLANDQDVTAKAYYDQHKDEFTGDQAAKLDKALEEGSLRGESQRQADAITEKTTDPMAALEQVRQITDPKLRDETDRRVRDYFSEQKQAEAEQQSQVYQQAAQIVDANVGQKARDVVPAPMWAQMTPEQTSALMRRAEDVPNDDKRWLDFLALDKNQVSSLSRTDFETKYWSNFDKDHKTRAETQWNAAQDAKNGDSKDLDRVLSVNQRIENTLRANRVITSNKSTGKFSGDEARTYAMFESEASARISRFQQENKRAASDDEVQKILDGLVNEKVFVDKNWLFPNPQKPAAALTQDEKGMAYVPAEKIPAGEMTGIESMAKQRGVILSDKQKERAYAAYLMRDRDLLNSILSGK